MVILTIGENIRKFRTELKLTQKELGEAIGTTQQMIAQYENGRRRPKVETLNKIAKALHTTVEELSNHTMMFYEFTMPIADLKHMFIDNKDIEDYKKIQTYYKLLNHEGKQEALKRVSELTEITKYTNPEFHRSELHRKIAELASSGEEIPESELRRKIAELASGKFIDLNKDPKADPDHK